MMRTSLEHLPQRKVAELERVLDLIKEVADPEKVILFGSHATGRWVEDHVTGYYSDYDILVVTKKDAELKDYKIESHVENKFQKDGATVSIVAHNMAHINRMLEESRYFFSDIQKEGVLLFDTGDEQFAAARELTPQERKAIAKEDYNVWFKSAQTFLKGTEYYKNELKELKIAVFELHQAAERTYNAILLIHTGYKPKTHSLSKLYRYTKRFSQDMAMVFPQKGKEERHLFDLLKRGYIDARYSKAYTITEEELSALIARVQKLQQIADELCQAQIAAYDKV